MNTLGTIMLWITILLAIFVPYLNHLRFCFVEQEYVLLIVGALLAPIGWIHGLGNLLGWW